MKKLKYSKKRPLIMGILNLTPDSFSDGGKFNCINSALKKTEELLNGGADILDIGAEASGPDSINISKEEEIKRLIPILKEIRKNTEIPISVDTYKSEVARMALDHGADIINDITALSDTNMGKVIANANCPYIMMYSKDKSPRTTIKAQKYQNIMESITEFFEDRLQLAKKMGIKKEQIIIDPGMGHYISSIPKFSYEIIANLKELKALNLPILLGISRKSMLGGKMIRRDETVLPITGIAYLNGVSIIRTHNTLATKEFFQHFNQD